VTSPDITASTPGPACAVCGGIAIVHWQRRLTSDEIAVEQAKEQARRDQLTALADPQLPPPDFGPMPDCADWTRAVYACMTHAINGSNDAGARIHQATCTAPNPADLPGCNCTPEPLPQPDPDPVPPELPPGW
jgi:hypothetical protein